VAIVGWAALIVTALVLAGVLVLVVLSLPDIARYKRLRRM
jgi:hypothetical protein